jgi:hypothetical protein
MANILYHIGKRLLISKSRGSVRGSVIFLITHLLLIIGIIFAAQIILVLLGLGNIYVPFAGWLIGLTQ